LLSVAALLAALAGGVVLVAADLSDNSTTLTQAFLEADEVLHAGVRGISDIITVSAAAPRSNRTWDQPPSLVASLSCYDISAPYRQPHVLMPSCASPLLSHGVSLLSELIVSMHQLAHATEGVPCMWCQSAAYLNAESDCSLLLPAPAESGFDQRRLC
jgi:hypothetical protein